MNHLSVRRRVLAVAALSAASMVVACEDKRVKQLDTGITRDSAMSVISQDVSPNSKPDSFPNVYKRERYLIAGKNYEVLYFNSDNKKQTVVSGKVTQDSVPPKQLTPLVFLDNKMVAKGWDQWDSVAKANKIPVQKP